MISYIVNSKNILFQRTKNILLQDIIKITYSILKVNMATRLGVSIKKLDGSGDYFRTINLHPLSVNCDSKLSFKSLQINL